jgi:hypothetical protein
METKSENAEFTREDGLRTIYAMISATKSSMGKNYLFFLLWGYLVGLACLSEYFLLRVVHYAQHYQVWPVFMGIGLVATGVLMFSRQRSSTHVSFIGNIMSWLWAGWFVSFSILMFFMVQMETHMVILPLTLVMYGMGIFISGGVISYRPLIYGGVLAWVVAMIAWFQSYEIQLLLTAGTVLLSYIIPGHMLRRSQKHSHE